MHVHASANIIYMQYAFNVHWGRMLLLRTYLVSVLRGEANGHFVKWSGLKCSTWVSISRPSTGRSFFAPEGNQERKCVAEGNQMAARCALVCALVFALYGTFVVEQPSSSLLFRHPRMQWLCGITNAGNSVVFLLT